VAAGGLGLDVGALTERRRRVQRCGAILFLELRLSIEQILQRHLHRHRRPAGCAARCVVFWEQRLEAGF